MRDLYYIWLSLACGAGSPVPQRLLAEFGGAERIYEAGADELGKPDFKMGGHILDRLLDKDLGECERILEYCGKSGVGVLTCDSEQYPGRLKNIRAFPAVLYYKGTLADLDDNLCVAMVGTRKMSEYGKRAAYDIARELAACGAVVVSGMASGIDSASHKGCLISGGYTVAVFGCGIDRVYPPENKELMDKIISTGLVLTEYVPGTEPKGANFPVRNRIISGLSQAVLIVEADNRSGALITAKTALFQGRELYAVPGNISSRNSWGSNALLKNQAGVVTSAYDILAEYEHLYSHRINMDGSRHYNNKKNYAEGGAAQRAEKKTVAKMSGKLKENAGGGAAQTAAAGMPLGEKLAALKIILNEAELKVFTEFYEKPGESLRPDDISPEGMGISDVINTLTFLEIYGIIASLPGDYYKISEGFVNL